MPTTVDRASAKREDLVYSVTTTGHRQSYLDTLGAIFALRPVSGRMNFGLFRRLVAADRLLFASLDDDMASFVAIAIMRSILGRPTAALFLRAQKCFERLRWYYPLKRHIFRTLRRLPFLTVTSILTFDVAPRHAQVAHYGVCDPQFWDLHDGKGILRPRSTALAEEISARAGGRPVLCALGTLSVNKGLDFLAETLERHPGIVDRMLVVAAGRVPEEGTGLARRMRSAGALIVDRHISDHELESLYGVADMIWACYAPDYDQASGVFGRAMQFGVEPIVRENSLIAEFAGAYDIRHLAVAYGAHETLDEMLQEWCRAFPHLPGVHTLEPARSSLINGWREQFVETLSKGMMR